jgi:hypothetical protein
LVRFGLNLALNNLSFDQEAISDRIDSIGSNRLDRIDSTRLDRLDRIDSTRSDRLDSIGSTRLDRIKLTANMASWSNFKLFRPKLSPNRTKNGHFQVKLS